MSKWVRRWFLNILPKYLLMVRPTDDDSDSLSSQLFSPSVSTKQSTVLDTNNVKSRKGSIYGRLDRNPEENLSGALLHQSNHTSPGGTLDGRKNSVAPALSAATRLTGELARLKQGRTVIFPPEVDQAVEGVQFIAAHLKKEQADGKVSQIHVNFILFLFILFHLLRWWKTGNTWQW